LLYRLTEIEIAMTDNPRRIALSLGMAAGGLAAAALVPMAVAGADVIYDIPDPGQFQATELSGIPPYTPLEATGSDFWSTFDATTNTIVASDDLHGIDSLTQYGSFTNDLFHPDDTAALEDYANFGGGWANEWVDFPSNLESPGISDLLITPFGDFPLLGTFF
jgi:hypothetical protein